MPPRAYRDYPIAYITADLPGIGGRLKEAPEDFLVEEVPAYAASGQGEHLFLFVEKRDLSTPELVVRLSTTLGIKPFEVGAAGRKDRRAVTRQWLSLPPRGAARFTPEEAARAVEAAGAKLLEAKLHTNKLKVGHLAGNRFTIVARGVAPDSAARAREIVSRLRALGVPNFFGAQRFGDRGKNVARGRALLDTGGRGMRGGPRGDRRFDASALQSDLFNRYLVRRIERGLYAKALLGDVMKKHDTGGLFTVEDPAAEQPRVDSLGISATGPIFGARMLKAKAEAEALEASILEEAKIAEGAFEQVRALMPGSRRITRLALPDLDAAEVEGGLKFSFTLPKGAYATVLLGEIQKSDSDIEEEDGEEDEG
jgi:tRNA pseudouridine13 synthase